jgi:Ankyrin repeats (many copies)/Ankyrin repeat
MQASPDNLEPQLNALMRAIAAGQTAIALRWLNDVPALAMARLAKGATRNGAERNYLDETGYYLYAGVTALHVAATAYQVELVHKLLGMGADVRARDRRGAEPIHAAAVGQPGTSRWNPAAQAATIACLIEAGADPDAVDKSGVTALHRAVRTRCAAAVKALLDGGADPQRRNDRGSTPLLLATRTSGRGGSGSPAAKEEQRAILLLLEEHGGTSK